jgi:hypothetical protein
MKKITFFLVLICLATTLNAQVFGTAGTLSPGKFALGINPVFYGDNLGLYLRGGVGITHGIDMELKYGFFENEGYFGADLEWKLLSGKPSLSLVTGAHHWGEMGLDLGLNLSFPINRNVNIFTGIDSDIYFDPNKGFVWLPIGVEIYLRRNMSLIFEGDIPLNHHDGIFGGGLAFYF